MVNEVNIEGVFCTMDHVGFTLNWMAAEGYGALTVRSCDDGITRIDSEHMSKEFVMAVLAKLVDDAELVE